MRKGSFAVALAMLALAAVPAHAATTQVVIAGWQYAPSGYVSADPFNLSGGAGIQALPAGTPTVTAGDTITFTSLDAVPHTVTYTSGPTVFSSPSFSGPGASKILPTALLKKGTYIYHCNIHAGMRGAFVVA